MTKNKTFVLRPNALLSSEESTLRFGSDNTVVIPMSVLDEINARKGMTIEKTRIKKKIFEYLASFEWEDLTSIEGVSQANGSRLRLALNFKDTPLKCETEELTSYQIRSLKVCKGLENQGCKNVILVTNNYCLRLRAEMLGIRAERFKDETFPALEDQYTGRAKIEVPKELINELYNEGEIPVERVLEFVPEISLVYNQFVILYYKELEASGKVKNVKAYTIVKDNKLKRLFMHERTPYQIKPLTDGQRLIFNALYDESPLVIIKGDAGTGKTFCTLAVGLDEIEKEAKYRRIIVSRKTDYSSMGYLPGDVEQKMGPFLSCIKDNLRTLINGQNKEGDENTFENGTYFFEKGTIQIEALELLRGRSICDAYIIIDETQNIEPEFIKTIITRAGKGTVIVFLGDPTQIDNPKLDERYNGLVYISEKMKGNPLCTQVTLEYEESVRGDLAKEAAKIL